jgi:hypothetical protein
MLRMPPVMQLGDEVILCEKRPVLISLLPLPSPQPARGIVAGRANGMLHWVRLEFPRNVIELLLLPDEGHRQRRQNQMLDYVE